MNVYYSWNSRNKKTGKIIQQWIGGTRKESKQSCGDCPLLPITSNIRCYAQVGTAAIGHQKILDNVINTIYTLQNALLKNAAKYVRFGTIGDPARIPRRTLFRHIQQVYTAGKIIIGYTHQWRQKQHQWLKKYLLASCESVQDFDNAVKLGWKATLLLPATYIAKMYKTPAGHTIIRCPAEFSKVQCITCGLCSVRKQPNIHIGFTAHGNKITKAAKWQGIDHTLLQEVYK